MKMSLSYKGRTLILNGENQQIEYYWAMQGIFGEQELAHNDAPATTCTLEPRRLERSIYSLRQALKSAANGTEWRRVLLLARSRIEASGSV